MEEAIFFHVPLVGMPFYLDQETNVRTIVEKKIGLRISPKELDTKAFTKTILEVISNPMYVHKQLGLHNRHSHLFVLILFWLFQVQEKHGEAGKTGIGSTDVWLGKGRLVDGIRYKT